ncbi:Asp-tRNA(Asn)/Glu-tRNA(Gln) amidotransferase subunit GatC [Patescibacteria group bacterium]
MVKKLTILSKKQVLHIAKLANLKLTKKEVSQFQKQLGEILDYIKILNELDTKKIKPTSQVTGLKNVFRQDKLGKCLSQQQVLSGSKSKHKGYFKVKSVFND